MIPKSTIMTMEGEDEGVVLRIELSGDAVREFGGVDDDGRLELMGQGLELELRAPDGGALHLVEVLAKCGGLLIVDEGGIVVGVGTHVFYGQAPERGDGVVLGKMGVERQLVEDAGEEAVAVGLDEADGQVLRSQLAADGADLDLLVVNELCVELVELGPSRPLLGLLLLSPGVGPPSSSRSHLKRKASKFIGQFGNSRLARKRKKGWRFSTM